MANQTDAKTPLDDAVKKQLEIQRRIQEEAEKIKREQRQSESGETRPSAPTTPRT